MEPPRDDKPKLGYEPRASRMSPDGWITLQWRTSGETFDWFPYRCCERLAEDHLRILCPENGKPVRIKIPICRTCRDRWYARRNRIVRRGVAIMLPLATLIWAISLRKYDWQTQLLNGSVLLGVGSMFVVMASHFCKAPVEVRGGGRGSKWVSVRFRNQAFWVYLAECDELKP